MVKQVIEIGTAPAGQDGDTNRQASIKTNSNFTELYTAIANTVRGPSQAIGGEVAVFSGTTGKDIVGGGVLGAAAFKGLGGPNNVAVLDANGVLINSQMTPALAALAPLTPAANRLPYFTAANAASVMPVGTFGVSLMGTANAAAALTAMGIPWAGATTSTAATDLNVINTTSVLGITSSTTNVPVGATSGSMVFTQVFNSTAMIQEVGSRTSNRKWLRTMSASVWGGWSEFVMTTIGGAIPVSQGGTGGTTQAAARTGLGLGTAATANLGRQAGQVLSVPMLGLGSRADIGDSSIMTNMNVWESSFAVIADPTQFKPIAFGTCLNMSFPGTGFLGAQLYMSTSPGNILGFRSGDFSSASFNTVYHTGNTTRAADGTLKAV